MGDRERHFFDNPGNRRGLVRGLVVACGVLLCLDAIVHRHVDHPWDSVFGFYALYGFIACVVLVLLAKEWRRLVMRGENYYEGPSSVEGYGKDRDNRDA